MRIAIVSGYFHPLGPGHLEMLHEARSLADKLVVIVNNDVQLMEKEGQVDFNEKERVKALKNVGDVDQVILSIDKDTSVRETLKKIAKENSKDKLIFCNGGDKETALDIPETEVCRENNIKLKFGIGENISDDPYDFLLD